MTCKDARKQLLAWLEGELDEATWLTITRHFETCPHCHDEAQRMQRLTLMLRAIAKSDGIPPVPERLWQRLTPRRLHVPKVVALFATACVAFLAGWQARGVSLPSKPPSPSIANVTKASAMPLVKTPAIVKPSVHTNLALGLPIIHSKATVLPVPSNKPLPAQIWDEPNRPHLTLAGATAIAVGWHEPPKHCPFTFSEKDQTKLPDNEPIFIWLTWTEPFTDPTNLTDLTDLTNPTNLTNPTDPNNPTPYRIFVQVTDPKEQVIRTVHVDTTQPEKIVAEWREQGM